MSVIDHKVTQSIDREFRYIIMWFNEFSEIQREDFIPILVDYLNGSNAVYMNGIVNAVNNIGISKPMSLFQCRIKLFREWSCKWPLEFKQKLQEKINEIDPKVGEKVLNDMKPHNDIHSNGNNAESDDVNSVTVNGEAAIVTVTEDIYNAALVNATEEAIISDNGLAALLNNETSVDDDVDDIETAAQLIEPVRQVQDTDRESQIETEAESEPEHANTLPEQTQTVLNNSAEVPLDA